MMGSCHKTLQSCRGYLMVEVLASLALFGIALGSLVPVLVTTIRGVDQAKRTTMGVTLGRDKLEEIRNTAYAAIANGEDTVTPTAMGAYTRTWTAAAGPAADTKAVTVTVRWTDRTNHQLIMQSIVGQ